ncbi:MAG TPA: polysaccharide pyruvyl transferase family protein [Planctomycetaceae bacterium]|nr:polysaccharide pyruvyl transferase family protein [Planctomycetaceae bacterium]
MSLRRKFRSLVERHVVVPHLMRRARRATAERPRSSGVLIMGWYGRETTGDKAILASLLHNIEGHSARILNLTYDVDYSRQTLNEIEAPIVRCLPNDIASFVKALDWVGVVVIGGGPLKESGQMLEWSMRLAIAKSLGKKIMIYGCGIGPLHSARVRQHVAQILRLADRITLRDGIAVTNAIELGIPADRITLAGDPAIGLVIPSAKVASRNGEPLTIGVSLRRLSKHYAPTGRKIEATLQESALHEAAKCTVRRILQMHGTQVVLVPMALRRKDDDRIVLRQMQTELGHDPRISLIEHYPSPAALLEHFRGFDFFVAMRFHSAVFAMLSGVPLVAIDYDSQGGKTTGLMEAMGLSEFVLNIADATPERLWTLVNTGLSQRAAIARRIAENLPALRDRERANGTTLRELLEAA